METNKSKLAAKKLLEHELEDQCEDELRLPSAEPHARKWVWTCVRPKGHNGDHMAAGPRYTVMWR